MTVGFEVIPPHPPLAVNEKLRLDGPVPCVVDNKIVHTGKHLLAHHHHPLVGIVGGISPAATLRLHALVLDQDRLRINQERCTTSSRDVEDKESGFLADSHYTPFLLYNNPQIPNNNLAAIGLGPPSVDELTRSAVALRNAGADAVGFACTTAYAWKDQVSHAARIPVIDLLDCIALRVQREGHKRVGLLDVDGTHETGTFRNSLERHGLEVVLPTPTEQQQLMQAVASIKAGSIKATNDDGPLQALNTICHRMANRDDISAIILGCTEIAAAIGGGSSPLPSSSNFNEGRNDLPSGIQFFDCLEILAEEVICPTRTGYYNGRDERGQIMPLSHCGRGLPVDTVRPMTLVSQ